MRCTTPVNRVFKYSNARFTYFICLFFLHDKHGNQMLIDKWTVALNLDLSRKKIQNLCLNKTFLCIFALSDVEWIDCKGKNTHEMMKRSKNLLQTININHGECDFLCFSQRSTSQFNINKHRPKQVMYFHFTYSHSIAKWRYTTHATTTKNV